MQNKISGRNGKGLSMAQKLIDVSIESFRLQVYKIPSKNLVKLIEQIYEIKRSTNGYLYANDLERKETIIEGELMRRKYYMPKAKPEEMKEYNEMKLKKFWRKRLF
jgi:hypothetical protein